MMLMRLCVGRAQFFTLIILVSAVVLVVFVPRSLLGAQRRNYMKFKITLKIIIIELSAECTGLQIGISIRIRICSMLEYNIYV